MNKQQALNTIVKALKKPDYIGKYDEPITLIEHPFIPRTDPAHPDLIDFTGFGSDDIYPFLACLLGTYQPVTQIILWLCRQKDEVAHHQIFAEARTEFHCYLVSGMTDYSGSGSHAYRELGNALEFLAEFYGIQIERRELEPGRDDHAWNLISYYGEAQRAEEAAHG
ncbi:MAG: hypothetical protein KJ077_33695 [Anaerolineae bacterium]|nr:hypothetical protein [Anaerolineae bacterium]